MRHLRLYRAIKLIVEEGSIRKASESLMISPSALNRQIQAFEEELGVQIFERVANGVRPSAPGELILRPIFEHLAQFDDYLELISEMKDGASGMLRVSVAGDLWPGVLAEVTAAFRARYPAVSLDLRHEDGLSLLRARQVDLALITVPVAGDDTDVLQGTRVPLTGVMAAEAAQAVAVSDLPQMRVQVAGPGTGTRAAVDLMLRRTGVRPAGLVSLPGTAMALQGGTMPDLLLGLGVGAPGGGGTVVDVSALRLAPVQVTIVARARGYLPRVAERYAVTVGGMLDAL